MLLYFLPFRSSSRPEAVKIFPITDSDKCSRKAVVTSAGALSHKTSAIVLAQEQSKSYKCPFFLMILRT